MCDIIASIDQAVWRGAGVDRGSCRLGARMILKLAVVLIREIFVIEQYCSVNDRALRHPASTTASISNQR
jgi:hypothetical protein